MTKLVREYGRLYQAMARHRVAGAVWSAAWAVGGLYGLAPGSLAVRSLREFERRCAA